MICGIWGGATPSSPPPPTRSAREVARRLGLTPTRVNRLARDDHRRLRAGHGLHVLSTQGLVGSDLLPAALSTLR